MITKVPENIIESVCNINYLSEIVGGKKDLIRGIMDAFLSQVSEDLSAISDAISANDYFSIKRITHAMKSSASIMGISVIKPVLEEMEVLGASGTNIDRIKKLYQTLVLIYRQAIAETEKERLNYV